MLKPTNDINNGPSITRALQGWCAELRSIGFQVSTGFANFLQPYQPEDLLTRIIYFSPLWTLIGTSQVLLLTRKLGTSAFAMVVDVDCTDTIDALRCANAAVDTISSTSIFLALVGVSDAYLVA